MDNSIDAPLKAKLIKLLGEIVNSSKMGKVNQLTIETLGRSLIAGVSETDLIKGITELRDKVIPWLLKNENQNKAE